MFDSTTRAFLQKPLIARLSTVGGDGYPHSVPIWFMLDGDDLVFISDRDARKVQNALANPKGAAVVGGDVTDDAGYLMRGDLVVEEDAAQAMTHRVIDRYQSQEDAAQTKAEWKNDDIVVIRLRPKAVSKVR